MVIHRRREIIYASNPAVSLTRELLGAKRGLCDRRQDMSQADYRSADEEGVHGHVE